MQDQEFSFETLNNFQAAVSQCEVSTQDGNSLTLIDGMGEAVSRILEVASKGNKVIMVGNGGSAAIASHQATDLWKNGNIRALAFNDASLLTCSANDFGYPEVFSQPIKRFADAGDLLIAISSSGNSINILNAVDEAKKMGCSVVGFSGFKSDNKLRTRGDLNFYLDSMGYGIVEVGHLLLLHTITDEVIRKNMR